MVEFAFFEFSAVLHLHILNQNLCLLGSMSVWIELRDAFRWWMIPLSLAVVISIVGALLLLAEPTTLPHEYRVE